MSFHHTHNCQLDEYDLFSRHLGTHTGERPLKCPHCDATWVDRTTLQRHISRAHSAGPAHICHICGKGFHILPDLKKHLKRHDGKLRVICDTCGDTFVDVTALQSHRVKTHGDDPVICDEWYGFQVKSVKFKLTNLHIF